MKQLRSLVTLIPLLFSAYLGQCCSCYTPPTFCGSTNQHSSVMLAKVIDTDTSFSEEYPGFSGIAYLEVLILEDFSDNIPWDTIHMPIRADILGSCFQSFYAPPGDTIFGDISWVSLPAPMDRWFETSICKRNWLTYRNDSIFGPIFPGIGRLSLGEFRNKYTACIERPRDLLMVNIMKKGNNFSATNLSLLFNDTLRKTNEKGIFNYIHLASTPLQPRTVFFSKKDEQQRGLSTQDLILIQKHILGIDTLRNPYQLLAADVNQSGTISILDLIQIQRLILGKKNSFLQGRDWLFIPAAYRFEDPQKPWDSPMPPPFIFHPIWGVQYERIVIIKVGDVDFSF